MVKYNAIIRFYGREYGGRFNPPQSGYKPQLRVGDEYTSCIIKSRRTNDEIFEFNIEYDVEIEIVFYEIYKDRIYTDMKIQLYEGERLVGEGKFIP